VTDTGSVELSHPADGVALIRLCRPEARNAIDTATLEFLLSALDEVEADPESRVLVISSADEASFSAGADVRERLDEDARVRRMELFAELYDRLTGFGKPTLAVCRGAVVGGGAEIAVACDIRVAGDNLGLRFPGAALGVPVGAARLVTLCGLATAKYLLLTSATIGAEEALRLGVVQRVTPAEGAEREAVGLAASIAEHEPDSVGRLKRMLHRWDGVEERSSDEGRGQVEWQRTGPGLPHGGD